MPKISIIVPVYKVEQYLHRCLDSIVNQTFTDWECILVADGSPDNSGKICDEYAEKDGRFRVIHQENQGVAQARLNGFEQSKGELITFIDSDDYVSELYLEKLTKPIIEDNADMVSCDHYNIENNITTEPNKKLSGNFDKEQITDFIRDYYFYNKQLGGYGMTCFLWTKMVKRKFVYDGLKQGLGLWFGEDQIAVFDILQKCDKLTLLSDKLYYYVHHENQASGIYKPNLWDNIAMLITKYKQLDNNGAEVGIRTRTWIYITHVIYKMRKTLINTTDLHNEIKKARNMSFFDDFFRGMKVNMGLKANIKYWLLKCKLFSLFFSIVKC